MRHAWIMAALLAGAPAPAQRIADLDRSLHWEEPVAPFRIAGPIYYVGTRGLAAYLIAGPAGAVLLDGTIAANVPLIERSIRALGFRLGDVKILLNSHAHYDHAAGLARLKRDTGATLIASAPDTPALERGERRGEHAPGQVGWFPPVAVDRTVRDGETIRLGPIALTAVLTPGHTPGCTTWRMPVVERGRRLTVVFACSLTVAANRLVGHPTYPRIVADYRASFARLDAMPADIVLTAHPEQSGVLERAAQGRLVDRAGLRRYVATARREFEAELAREQAGGRR